MLHAFNVSDSPIQVKAGRWKSSNQPEQEKQQDEGKNHLGDEIESRAAEKNENGTGGENQQGED
ncbi:MAG: hypothetical protein A3K09_03470 [Nitrospinae bacterium RIFCSPLOWO2_12_FULL_47_7]|nr:MAG: hypothetical protein A3K09_03470 [Nitrospinae bacterium RIFCSPLOWO2_12_FULL_47_7]